MRIPHLALVSSDVRELHLLGPVTVLDAGEHLRLEIKLQGVERMKYIITLQGSGHSRRTVMVTCAKCT